jgi:hypothetical protein
MKKKLDLLSKNRIPAKFIFTDGDPVEEKKIFSFRPDAYAFFNFLGNCGGSEFEVQINFSSDPLNGAEDRLLLERKFSKSYLLDLVLNTARKNKKHPVVNVSFERLFQAGDSFDELLNIAEEKLAKETSLHLSFNPPVLDVSEVTDDSPVEVFFCLKEWEGGVMTTFKTIRDYVILSNPEE